MKHSAHTQYICDTVRQDRDGFSNLKAISEDIEEEKLDIIDIIICVKSPVPVGLQPHVLYYFVLLLSCTSCVENGRAGKPSLLSCIESLLPIPVFVVVNKPEYFLLCLPSVQ